MSGQGISANDRSPQAAALIRALTGVLDAAVTADGGAIRSIDVVVAPGVTDWEVTRNVQSALMASLGVAVDPKVVRVHASGTVLAEPGGPNGGVGSPPSPPPPTGSNRADEVGDQLRPHKPVANGRNGPSRMARNGKLPLPPEALGTARRGRAANGKRPGAAVPGPAVAVPSPVEPPPLPASAAVARVELEAGRPGRVSCRVVVAMSERIAAGEAEGPDTPTGRLEAAARAAVLALPVASTELDGVRPIELAGRKYIVVAVRRWSGLELTYRADVAPVRASPEAAAAQAAVDAVLQ